LAFPIWGDEAFVPNLFKYNFLDFSTPLITPRSFLVHSRNGESGIVGYQKRSALPPPGSSNLGRRDGKEDQWAIFGATKINVTPRISFTGVDRRSLSLQGSALRAIPGILGSSSANGKDRMRANLADRTDNKAPMPVDLLGRYLEEMAGRFGAPTMDRHRLSNDKEMIFVYRFDNMAANARGAELRCVLEQKRWHAVLRTKRRGMDIREARPSR
jgi:hypothetical protein